MRRLRNPRPVVRGLGTHSAPGRCPTGFSDIGQRHVSGRPLRCRSGFRSEAGPACRSTATGLAGDAGHASPGRWRRTGTRRWAMPGKGQGRVNSRRHHRQNCTQWRRTARVEGVRCRPDGDGSGSRRGGSAGVGRRSGGAPAAARRRVAWGVAREGGGPKIEEGGTGDFDWPTFAASGTSVGPPLAGRDGLPRPHVAKLSRSRSTGRGRCMALVKAIQKCPLFSNSEVTPSAERVCRGPRVRRRGQM